MRKQKRAAGGNELTYEQRPG